MKSNQKQRVSPTLSPQEKESHFRTYSSGSIENEEHINNNINYQYQDEMHNMMDLISMPNQSMSMSNLSQISQSPFNGGQTPSRPAVFNVNQQQIIQHSTSSATKLSNFISQMQKSNHSQSLSSLQVSNQKYTHNSELLINKFNKEIENQVNLNNPQSFRSSQNINQNMQTQNDKFLKNIEIEIEDKNYDNNNYNQQQNLNSNTDFLKFKSKAIPNQNNLNQLNQKNRTFADSVLLQGMISKQKNKLKEDTLKIEKQFESNSPLSAIRSQFVNFQENGENIQHSKADMSGISNITAITGVPKSIQFRMNIPKTPDRSEFATSNKELSNHKKKQQAEINISDLGLSQLIEKQDKQINNILEKSDIGGLSDISALYPNKSPFVMRFNNNQEGKQNEEDIELKEALNVQQDSQIQKDLVPSIQSQKNEQEIQQNQFQVQEAQKLRVELSLNKIEVNKYKMIVQQKNQDIFESEQKNKKSQEIILDLESKIQEISDQYKILHQSQRDHSQLPSFLSRAQENARKEISNLKQQIHEKDELLMKQQKQFQFEKNTELIENQCLIQQIQNLCEQVDSEKLISAGIKNKINQLQLQHQTQETSLKENLEKEILLYNDKCKQMETYIQQIIKEYQEKEDELQQVYIKYNYAQTKEKEVSQNNDILNKEVENLKQRCLVLERDLEAKSNININKSQQKDFEFELKKQRDNYTKQNSQLKEEKQQLLQQLNDYKAKFEQMNGDDLEEKLIQSQNVIQEQLYFIDSVQDLIKNSQFFKKTEQDYLDGLKEIILHAQQCETLKNDLISTQQLNQKCEQELNNREIQISTLQKDVINLQKQLEQGPSSFTKNLLLQKDKEIVELKNELKQERLQLKNIEEKLWHSEKNKEILDIKTEELNKLLLSAKQQFQNKDQEFEKLIDSNNNKENQYQQELNQQKNTIFELQQKENEKLREASENLMQYVKLKNMFDEQVLQINDLNNQLRESQQIQVIQNEKQDKVLTFEKSCQYEKQTQEKSIECLLNDDIVQQQQQLQNQINGLMVENESMGNQIREMSEENEYLKQTKKLQENQVIEKNFNVTQEIQMQLQKLKDLNYELSKELKSQQQKIQIQNLEAQQLQSQVQLLQENEQNLIENIKNNKKQSQSQQTEQINTNIMKIFEQIQNSIVKSNTDLKHLNQYVLLNTILYGNSKQMRIKQKLFPFSIKYFDIIQLIQLVDFQLVSQSQFDKISNSLYFVLSSIFNYNRIQQEFNYQNSMQNQLDYNNEIYLQNQEVLNINNQLQFNIDKIQKDFEKDIEIKIDEISKLNNELKQAQSMFDEQYQQNGLLKEEFKQIIEGLENQKQILEKEFEQKLYKCKKEQELEFKIKLKEQQQTNQQRIDEIQSQQDSNKNSQMEKQQQNMELQIIQYKKQIENLEDELSYQKQKEQAQQDINNYNLQNETNGIIKFETILDLEFQKILLSLKMKSQNMSIDQLNSKRDQLNKNIQKIQNEDGQGGQLKKSMDNIKKNISEVLKLFKESLEYKSQKKFQEYEIEINRLNKLSGKQLDKPIEQSQRIIEIQFKIFKDLQSIYQSIRSSQFFKICAENNDQQESLAFEIKESEVSDQNCNDIKNIIFKYISILNQGAKYFENEIQNLNQSNIELKETQLAQTEQTQEIINLLNSKYERQKQFFIELSEDENALQMLSEQSQSLILKAIDLSECIDKLMNLQEGILYLFMSDQYINSQKYLFLDQYQQIQINKLQNLTLNKNIAEINQKCLTYTIEMIGSNNENTFCSNQLKNQNQQDFVGLTKQSSKLYFEENNQSEQQTDERYYDQMTPQANQKQAKGTINIEEMSQDQAVDLLAKVFQKLNLTGVQDETTTRQNWIDNGIQEGLLNHTQTTSNLLGNLKNQIQKRGVFASQEYCRNIENQKYKKLISQRFISENSYPKIESVHQSIESIQQQNKTIQSNENPKFYNNKNNDDCIKQAESLLKMFKKSQESNSQQIDNRYNLSTQTNFPLQLNFQQKSSNSKKVNSQYNQNDLIGINQFHEYAKQNNNFKTNQKNNYQENEFVSDLKIPEYQLQENSQNKMLKVPLLQLQNQTQEINFQNKIEQQRKNSIKSSNTQNQRAEINRNNIQRASINTVQDHAKYIRTIDLNHQDQSNFDFYSCNDEKHLDPQEVRRKLLQRIEGVVSPISSYKNMQVCTSAENLTKRLDYKSGERAQVTSFTAEMKPQNWQRMNSAKAIPQKTSKFQTVDSTENSINFNQKRQNQKIPRPNLPKQKIYQGTIDQQKQIQQNLTFRHRQNEIQLQKQQQPTQKQQMKQNRYQQHSEYDFNNKNGDYETNQDEFTNNFQSIESKYQKVQQFNTIQERPVYRQNFFIQQNESLKDNLLSIDSAAYNKKIENQKHQMFFNDDDEVPTVIMEDFN